MREALHFRFQKSFEPFKFLLPQKPPGKSLHPFTLRVTFNIPSAGRDLQSGILLNEKRITNPGFPDIRIANPNEPAIR